MPLETSVFPEEVQMAFFISDFVSEKWDGMSGTYMGKNWIETTQLFDLYEVEDRKEVLYFMKVYDSLVQRKRMADQKRKESRNKQKGGDGTTYTHNIQG
tara:strand:- start:1224 stop:1520 length:297 start_codon:yes stop_codon:yes gene_type:complete